MAVDRILISEFLRRSEGRALFDVRSPGEYHHAHVPGALSLPLFSDEERKEVGTAYKQVSREKAIKIGLDYFGPKMRNLVEEVETEVERRGGDREIFLYCWRGGMRSGAVAWLLDLYGFRVTVLAGGYKSFRNWALAMFEQSYPFGILGGFTGSGKTEVLHELRGRGERIIDLEALASHKGSAFGNLNMPPQPRQEMFENLLAMDLDRQTTLAATTALPSTIWLEDESQRIGDVNIPLPLWKSMRRSPIYFLEVDFEHRLDHLTEEYGPLDRDRLKNGVERISKRLGGLEAKNALAHLEVGNMKEAFRILLRYYDKFYLKGLYNREALETLLKRVPCERVTAGSNADAVLECSRIRTSAAR